MADPRLKQIRIKTGVVNRIAKEKQSYETETETEKNRLLKFKENGKSLKYFNFAEKTNIYIIYPCLFVSHHFFYSGLIIFLT